MKTKFTSIKSVIQEYIDLVDPKDNADKNLLKKWANDIIDKLITDQQYEHKVVQLCLDNHSVELPEDFGLIVQVAFRGGEPKKCKRTEIVEWTQKTFDGCELNITLDCPKCHKTECTCETPEVVLDVDEMWRKSHPEFGYGHNKFMRTWGSFDNTNLPPSMYHPDFKIIKYARHDYFNADYHLESCLKINQALCAHCPIEYNVHDCFIRVNRQEGDILLAYLAIPTDDEGYRKVPDIPDVFEAVRWYLVEMMSWRTYYKTRVPSYRMDAIDAKAYKEQAMGRARELLQTPDFGEWKSWLDNMWNKVYPYYEHFESMNMARRDRFDVDMSRLTRME